MIRKIINNSITRLELRIDRIERGENLMEPIVHINNMTFNKAALVFS